MTSGTTALNPLLSQLASMPWHLRAALWLGLVLPFVLTVIERLPLLFFVVSAIVCGVAVLLCGPFLMARWIDSRIVPHAGASSTAQ